MSSPNTSPIVGIIMGSDSDLDMMKGVAETLELFEVPFEVRFISAHRTPEKMIEYARTAEDRGLKLIIAGAGGSAHLPGMTASETNLPVIAVPVKRDNHDHEALWSNIKMPPGVPLATMPENGSMNAALYAVRILALGDTALRQRVVDYRRDLYDGVVAKDTKVQGIGWRKYLGE